MEEEGVMVTCGKLILNPATENLATENLAVENSAPENQATESTLTEVLEQKEDITVEENGMAHETKSMKEPVVEEVDPVQEVAVEAENLKEENFENVQEMVGTKPEDTETTLEEISSESLQGSVGATINNNTDIISAEKSVSSITSVELMETVPSVGQMLEESESYSQIKVKVVVLDTG